MLRKRVVKNEKKMKVVQSEPIILEYIRSATYTILLFGCIQYINVYILEKFKRNLK